MSANIVDINFLPRESRPIEASPIAIAFAAVVAVAILALIPLSIVSQRAGSDATSAERRADEAADQLAALQIDLTTHRGLRASLESAEQQLATLSERREAFQGGANPLAHDLQIALDPASRPAGIVITRVSSEADILRIVGLAPGPLEALDLASALADAGPYDDVKLASFAPADSGGEFTLEVAR